MNKIKRLFHHDNNVIRLFFFSHKHTLPKVPWHVWDGIKASVFSVLTIILLVSLPIYLFESGQFSEEQLLPLATFIQHNLKLIFVGVLLLQIIIELGYLYFFTKRKYPEVTWKDFGLRPFDKVSAFEFALLLLVFIWIAETAFMYYLDQVEANTAVDSQVKSYLFGGIAPTWVLVVFGTLIAPFVEELVFRGFLLSALIPELQKWFKNLNHKIFSDHHWYKTFGYWTGIFISSALFTGAHLQWLPVPLYFMMGVILSVLFVHSKSLWPGIIFHMINNGVAFGIMFYQYHFG